MKANRLKKYCIIFALVLTLLAFFLAKPQKIAVFAYLYGVKTDDVEKVLKEKDYKLAFLLGKSSLSSREDDHYAIKRISIDDNTTMRRFKGWLLKEILL